MKKRKLLLSLLLVPCLLTGGHLYLEWAVKRVITQQIAENQDRIKSEMTQEILRSLEEDEETQEQVQGLLTAVVEKELETNGEKHIRRIIRDKYPYLESFLAQESSQ